jgi:hypothetical protein
MSFANELLVKTTSGILKPNLKKSMGQWPLEAPASDNPLVLNRSLALTPPARAAWRPAAPLKISVAS